MPTFVKILLIYVPNNNDMKILVVTLVHARLKPPSRNSSSYLTFDYPNNHSTTTSTATIGAGSTASSSSQHSFNSTAYHTWQPSTYVVSCNLGPS